MDGDGQARRLEFGRGRSAGKAPAKDGAKEAGAAPRKHVPMEDVLAKMAGKIGERRRAAEAGRAASRGEGEPGESA